MKRQIIIRNPFNEFDLKIDRRWMLIRYWLVSKLLTKYEKEEILIMLENATDIIRAEEMKEKYGLYGRVRAFSGDILKYKLKSK